MKTIKTNVNDLYEIKKSEFYSFLISVTNMEEVKNHLVKIRKEHKTARHVCYACIMSQPRVERCSDDGEPDGTAGKPLLELLKKRGLENVLLVVVRYFGGIKLGAGGLIRAYTNAGVLVCDKAEVVELVNYNKYTILCNTNEVKTILSKLKQHGLDVEKIEYGENVTINVSVAKDKCCVFEKTFENVCKVIKNEWNYNKQGRSSKKSQR